MPVRADTRYDPLTKGKENMKKLGLVAEIGSNDIFFLDWLLDLDSAEARGAGTCDERLWAGVRPAFAAALVREN